MKFIKRFELFTESMVVQPDNDYSKYNLEYADGIDPMSVTDDQKGIDSILDNKRRVAWISSNIDQSELPNGYSIIKMYDFDNVESESARVGMSKCDVCDSEFSKNFMYSIAQKEHLIFNNKYKKQAMLVHKELLRRGGFWYQTNPESDIYLARLMGYGEEYIVPYIRKYFPDFDVDGYILKNPRELTLNID